METYTTKLLDTIHRDSVLVPRPTLFKCSVELETVSIRQCKQTQMTLVMVFMI